MSFWTTLVTIGLIDQDQKIRRQQRELEELKNKSFPIESSSGVKQSTRAIFDYIVANDGEDITAQDITDSLGINIKSVNGSITGFQKKGLIIREEKNGIRLIKLTDKGRELREP